MRRALLHLGLLFGLCLAADVLADPLPAAPVRWATDTAGMLTPATLARLDARLAAFEHATGHQVLVWTGDSIGTQALEDWAARTFAAWKVGRKGLDDGAVLFVLARDRKVRLEVGYGLEAQLTDLTASRILREDVLPRLHAGDADGAVTAGVDRLLTTLGGAPQATQTPALPPLGLAQKIIIAIFGLLFLMLLLTHPRLALMVLYSLMSGRRSDGGGGGGFVGGGGRSGGGGASGSW